MIDINKLGCRRLSKIEENSLYNLISKEFDIIYWVEGFKEEEFYDLISVYKFLKKKGVTSTLQIRHNVMTGVWGDSLKLLKMKPKDIKQL